MKREQPRARSFCALFALVMLCVAAIGMTSPAIAGAVEIVDAKATRQSDGRYGFDVTLKHEDTGWEHYADRWDVVGPDGKVIASRTLYHPHVNEQPFTRSLNGVRIPDGVTEVTIKAHDTKHGLADVGKVVTLRK